MWEIIRAGGGFMWPIILCSIAAVAIILERLWTLQSSRVIPRDLSQKVWNWIEADQLSEKLIVALEQNSPLGKLLRPPAFLRAPGKSFVSLPTICAAGRTRSRWSG